MARGKITLDQFKFLMMRLRSTRVAHRDIGWGNNKQSLSYLESWDVRAQLIRIFGFGNFDITLDRERLIGVHDYMSRGDEKKNIAPKPMAEVIWQATVTLVVRDPDGGEIARYTEAAVGSATGGSEGAGIGDLHDNALKSATSDAMKRCCINLGTQFGLSLYDSGNVNDVVRDSLVKPAGWEPPQKDEGQDPAAGLDSKLGAQQVTPTGEGGNEGGLSDEDVAATELTGDRDE